jgi:HEXXH motif-containing protein
MEVLGSLIRGFSCPQVGIPDEVPLLIAAEFAGAAISGFTRRYETELSDATPDLLHLLNLNLDTAALRESVGDPAFGDAFNAQLGVRDAPLLTIGAALGLRLCASGVPGQWAAPIERTVRLRWGRHLLPVAERIAVRSDGTNAEVRSWNHGVETLTAFRREGDGWCTSGAGLLPQLAIDGTNITVLPRHALSLVGYEHLLESAVDDHDNYSDTGGVIERLEGAVEILSEYSPTYLSWVRRVVQTMFLVRPHRGYIESGSLDYSHGFIHISATSEIAAAELLVHEASHQYFHLLCALGSFDDGTDRELYFSPAVGRYRPLMRVGVAYHAFANILLFYDDCIRGGLADDGYCKNNQAAMMDEVQQLAKPLRDHPGLTEVGRALCEPLMERLDTP